MRPALEVADIFRHHGDAFRAAQGESLAHAQRRVMSAIEICRTAALGGHVERCADCAFTRIAYNSCRNRHCPKCQGLARAQWLADRQAELLPVAYFHLVFTMPALNAACSRLRKSRRQRRESTRTGRKKPSRQERQRPSPVRPPPGTMQ